MRTCRVWINRLREERPCDETFGAGGHEVSSQQGSLCPPLIQTDSRSTWATLKECSQHKAILQERYTTHIASGFTFPEYLFIASPERIKEHGLEFQ